ncbi:MAG: NADH-quinone oxidoreductase subunit J [Elusimicrobiota bacterium]
MLAPLVFYSLAAVVLLSALAVVTLRNTVHSALSLGLCLLGVAGLFASLGADFLFAGQILIYVGGIAVLIMFVVMLLGRASDLHLRQVNNQWMAGLLICGISLFGLLHVIGLFSKTTATVSPVPSTRLLGLLLMSDYAVPFELISLVLLASLLGAIFFSKAEAE